jgi:hypothetical protein
LDIQNLDVKLRAAILVICRDICPPCARCILVCMSVCFCAYLSVCLFLSTGFVVVALRGLLAALPLLFDVAP